MPSQRSSQNSQFKEGYLAENIMHFARTLRKAGLSLPPARVLEAIDAITFSGLTRRDDIHATFQCLFINSRDQQEIFDQCFHIFWRNPEFLERAMSLLLPTTFLENAPQDEKDKALKRVSQAFAPEQKKQPAPEKDEEEPEIEFDARLTSSDEKVLRHKDFEQMSAQEQQKALNLIKRLQLPAEQIKTRRFSPSVQKQRIDTRRTMQASMRRGADIIELKYKAKKIQRAPLVILCDISGSMSEYSRMLLHFIHSLISARDRIHSFTFGTELHNITRQMKYRDVDEALAAVGQQIDDWSGGTRISSALHDFNQHWSRRVLGQRANVLLITDGLERDGAYDLSVEMDRLHKSCRKLIWLNPLLRYDAFQAKARGIKLMLPHVDEFRSAHNINSLEGLIESLQNNSRPAQ
ncbi:von Willebrand factor A [Kiloniella spongiae]|uniref:von Willebrand factor A n=1 Tax=Kiloniella spongiae TaxID=1489064 RepID=A0A0H2MJ36_9PROT|nr:VWA domain-containing protein [Kiloniella spongiae]KLN62554.1 von Willebrand factor A [Kiloniella spongiae]